MCALRAQVRVRARVGMCGCEQVSVRVCVCVQQCGHVYVRAYVRMRATVRAREGLPTQCGTGPHRMTPRDHMSLLLEYLVRRMISGDR